LACIKSNICFYIYFMPAIPELLYPVDLDSDYTLFKAYNSTQGILSKNIDLETDEIELITKDDYNWPGNGFVTIEEELIYYDQTERNDFGKLIKLKKCLRAIEGKRAAHLAGCPIYGNVVAQHHNRLVDSIVQIEHTIGDLRELLNTPEQMLIANVDMGFSESLHAALGNLTYCAPVGDDACPDVEFEFNFLSPTEAEFCLRIFGEYTSFKIDFDDGNFTTTEFAGTHTYSGAGTYSPTVTVESLKCCILQQPTTPTEGCEAPILPTPSIPFSVKIPDVPEFPSFIRPSQTCPGQLFNLPPILIPSMTACEPSSTFLCTPIDCPENSQICSFIISVIGDVFPSIISIEGCCPPSIISIISCTFPSEISIVGCCPPSVISIEGCCPPSVISIEGCCPPSIISIVGCCPPSIISFNCCVPSEITFNCCPPSEISIVGCCPPSVISFDCCNFPSIISFADCCNFPSTISLIAKCCEFPSVISMTCCDIPSEIKLVGPSEIKLVGPSEIKLVGAPSEITIVGTIPSEITLTGTAAIPSEIKIICCTIPSEIKVTCCENPPSFDCIKFCDPPSFSPIQFGTPPTVNVNWGSPPTLSCIVSVNCPSTSNMAGPLEEFENAIGGGEIPNIPVAYEIPEVIKLVHNLPRELTLKVPENIVIKTDMPTSIKLEAADLPKSIKLEPAPNFPSVIRVVDMPDTLSVTGIPKSIEIIGFPSFIQMVMPENPVVEMKYMGGAMPLDVRVHLTIDKILSDIIIANPAN
jgi:hypothetical protein